MDSLRVWWDSVEQLLITSVTNIGAYLPTLGAAIAVMIAGWLVAKLARAVLTRIVDAFNRALGQFQRPGQAGRLQISGRLIRLTGNFVFWIIIVLFAAAAARMAGLDTFSEWLDRVVDYVPTLIAGLLIAFAGYLLSTLARDIVAATFSSVGTDESEIAGLVAQAGVFITALVIGLDQIGIDVTFLISLASVIVAGVVLSIAIAFGLGARDLVSNLIAANQMRNTIVTGDYTKCGSVEGRVVEVTSTMVVLANERGRVLVPAAYLQSHCSEVLLEHADE